MSAAALLATPQRASSELGNACECGGGTNRERATCHHGVAGSVQRHQCRHRSTVRSLLTSTACRGPENTFATRTALSKGRDVIDGTVTDP